MITFILYSKRLFNYDLIFYIHTFTTVEIALLKYTHMDNSTEVSHAFTSASFNANMSTDTSNCVRTFFFIKNKTKVLYPSSYPFREAALISKVAVNNLSKSSRGL